MSRTLLQRPFDLLCRAPFGNGCRDVGKPSNDVVNMGRRKGITRLEKTSRSTAIACSRRGEIFQNFALGFTQQQQQLEGLAEDQDYAIFLLQEFQEASATPLYKLRQILDALVEEMEAGLAKEGGSHLKMIPTFVNRLPSGAEEGLFYALDLGGTNFRVLRAQLGGTERRLVKQEYEEVSIPQELMTGKEEDLFDFIASKLADFVSREESIHHEVLPGRKRELGFTFSFPVKQTSISSGTLMHWSKGFKVHSTVGKDIVEVLRSAISRQGLEMHVAALVNDTVGTLAGGRYWNKNVMSAVILGTGTNACYVERASAVTKWDKDLPESGIMVINTEWGCFDSVHLPKTYADLDLDAESVNPGEHLFEKLISGLYLGDLVRRVLLKMASEAFIFGEPVPKGLTKMHALTTPDISKMHADDSAQLEVVGQVLQESLGIYPTSLEQRRIAVTVSDVVTRRAARLAAAGIVGILKKMGRDEHHAGETVIAMDGGLYEHYQKFRDYLHAAVVEILGEKLARNIDIQLSKDGSGTGAVLVAACHSQYN